MENREPGQAEEHNGLSRETMLPKILKFIESISGTGEKKFTAEGE